MKKLGTALALLLILVISIGSISCGRKQATPTATLTPTPMLKETVRVMTYNILNGASIDVLSLSNKEWLAANYPWYTENRLQKVINVIRNADPDILGIEEAHQWEIGASSTAKQVADALGMNYFFGQSTNPEAGFCSVVLYTKFDIIETESYSQFFSRAALRAKLTTRSGESIQVFVVHLSPNVPAAYEETSILLEKMQPYIDDLTIMMGDLNFADQPGNYQANLLHQAGWKHPVESALSAIDQVWISPKLEQYIKLGPMIPTELTYGTSDHQPVVMDIGIP